MANIRLDVDAQSERASFRKRTATMVKKAKELSERCRADVCILIRHEGKLHAFSSKNLCAWPLDLNNVRTSS